MPRGRFRRRLLVGFFAFCLCLFLSAPGFAWAWDGRDVSIDSSEREPLPSLPELEARVGDGPEALAALAALARGEHLLQVESERLTPRLFAGLTYGYGDEPLSTTSEERHAYSQLSGRLGVSFPLLGTWTRQKIERMRADLARTESLYRSELARYNNRIALQKAYAVLWIEQRRRPILETFLGDEPRVMQVLEDRAGKNLLLDSDRLEFASAFDMVRRDVVASKLNVSRALAAIAAATGRRWSLPDRVERPELPGFSGLARGVSRHPELRGREEAARFYEEIARLTRRIDRDATLDVGVTAMRDFPGTWGFGAYVGLSVREPFGSLSARSDSARAAASADVERARWEARAVEMRLQDNLEEQLLWNDYARESLRVGATRLGAAQESVRERALRHRTLPGDTFEQFQRARYALLRTAMDVIDAESLAVQTYVELLAFFAPDGRGEDPRLFPLGDAELRDRLLRFPPLSVQLEGASAARADPGTAAGQAERPKPVPQTPLPPPSGDVSRKAEPVAIPNPNLAQPPRPVSVSSPPVSAPPPAENASWPHRAVYVWNAAPFLDGTTCGDSLDRLRRSGFDRLLLSFSADEVQALRSPDGADRLRNLLREAARRGLVVDLLLGDPAWILPAARGGLKGVLRFFAPFPFRAVHLDLEPDMLEGAEHRREELLGYLLDTLSMAVAAAGRPVEIVVHPRYLEGELGKKAEIVLMRLGIAEVAVMLYSTNRDGVAERFASICKAHPRLRFSLVQSVEKVLPRAESYFEAGLEGFEKHMRLLYGNLGGSGLSNVAGLVVQSFEDYIALDR